MVKNGEKGFQNVKFCHFHHCNPILPEESFRIFCVKPTLDIILLAQLTLFVCCKPLGQGNVQKIKLGAPSIFGATPKTCRF